MQRYVILMTSIMAFLIVSLVPSIVKAQSPPEQRVIDEANVFGDRIDEVVAAAEKLLRSGADIRVRTIRTYGASGNLDRFEQELEEQNTSWTAPDGSRKNNLIVLIMSLEERQTGLYYGSQWDGALGNDWIRIQTDIMNPRFQRGDFASGFIRGLDEINRLVEQQVQGQVVSPKSTGMSLWWLVLIILVAIPGVVVGILLFTNHQKNRERRLAARQKALLAKQMAASSVNELVEKVQMLEIKVDVIATKVSPEEAAPLVDGLSKAKRLVDQGSQTYSELFHSAGDPENPKLGETQLGVIEQEYQKVVDILHQARDVISQEEAQIATLQQAVERFPGKVAEANTALEEVLRKCSEAQKADFGITYLTELVAKARHSLEHAIALSQKKQFSKAMEYLDGAGNLVSQAAVAADELPGKKKEAEIAIPALFSHIEQVKATIDKGRLIFDRISTGFAESSWESIRGNGTEAENRVAWTLEVVEEARTAAGPQHQEFHQALDLVEKGKGWLEEAESFMRSISALEVNLTAAQRDANVETTSAQSDIAKAWAYINQHDEDIRESLEDELRQAERKLGQSNDELKKDKPDYLMVCRLAREANEASDRILAQARDEHEAAERLRAKATAALRNARASVSRAKEYIEDHRREVGGEAGRHLFNATTALREAEIASNLEARISFAVTAESEADIAYSQARNSVTTRREWHEPSVIILPRGGSWGGDSSWGSRRGGFGGGGSSRWGSMGGGGRGGGGSTGW